MQEEHKDPARWESCCFAVDRDAVKFITQVMFGVSVVAFSMFQIVRETKNPEIYFSLLSATVGVFMPHPEIKDK
jgi:hypothetical protein